MFAQFSANLFNLASAEEYQMANSDAPDITTTSHWMIQKIEMSTLICLNVIDSEKINWADILAIDSENRTRAETLRGKIGQVALIYMLVGGETPDWNGAEEYFGQEIYSVFWHISSAGEISVPKGQPKKLFGLRAMAEKSFANVSVENPTNLAEFGKHVLPLQPKHNFPAITYLLITANIIILGLMYVHGFPSDFWIPRTFGAIYPPWVFEHNQWWRLFTAIFAHFGPVHLGANAFALLIFATRVEKYFGRAAFCLIYVFSGLTGSIASLFISTAYSAGASGAVYGLIGAMFAYTRLTKRSIEFMNWYLMFMFIGVGIAMGYATPGIDNAGHIGGLIGGAVVGVVYAKFFKTVGVSPPPPPRGDTSPRPHS